MRNAFIFLLLTFLPLVLTAQVNTEKLRRADSTLGVFFTSGISLGLDRGNSEYVSASGALRLDWSRPANDNFIIAQYDFRESERGKISNRGFLHLRTMWELTRLLGIESFAQAEFNEFISLKNRELIGVGTRWHPLHISDSSSGLSMESFIGVGLMFEHEFYTTVPGDVIFDRLRSTNYLTLIFTFGGGTALQMVSYYQPLFSDPGDFRYVGDASLEFGVTRSLTFTVTASYRYNSRPVLDVRRYDLQLRNGIRVSLP
jgi:hypothetical protein